MSTATATSPQTPSTPWWVVLIEGIAAVIVGLLLLSNPARTTLFLVQVLGIYWLISGIITIISIFVDSTAWGWKLFSGIIGILAGILIMQHPLWSTLLVPTVLVWLLGFGGIIMGVIGLIRAFQGEGWGIGVLGVVSILLGIMLLGNQLLATLALPFVLGIFAIIGGIIAIIMAFRIRSEPAPQAPVTAVERPPQPAATEAAAAPSAAEDQAPVAAGSEEAEPQAAEAVPAAAPAAPAEAPEAAAEAVHEPTSPEEMAKFNQDLTYIEGIGAAYAPKLKAAGVATPLELLEQGATRKGRQELAEKSGLSEKLILKWVNHVDLYRVQGVGSEYADLLEASGVDTVPELAQRNPANLHAKLLEVNEAKKLVRQPPSEQQVSTWVAEAKVLPRKITY